MKIYTCQDRLTDIMTCIYDAWSEALKVGHNQIGVNYSATELPEHLKSGGIPPFFRVRP